MTDDADEEVLDPHPDRVGVFENRVTTETPDHGIGVYVDGEYVNWGTDVELRVASETVLTTATDDDE